MQKASTLSRSNCRKHQRHKQSPGICSICLNEKLSQLISTPIINNSSSSSSQATKSLSSSSSSDLSSLSSSSNPSSCSSPTKIGYSRKMDHSKGRKSIIRVFKNHVVGQNDHVLNKSRSMASVVPRRRTDDDENGKKFEVGVKRGFWSKLLPRTSKGLMHSRTMRERVIPQFIS